MIAFTKNILFLFCLLSLSKAWSKIPLTSIKIYNASNVIMPDTTSSTSTGGSTTTTQGIRVYGGIAGSVLNGECASGVDPAATCNNCTNLNQPCNANRIRPDTLLRIEFQTDNSSVITNTTTLFLVTGASRKIIPTDASTTLSTSTTLYITVKWSDLCSAIEAGADCSVNKSDSIQFGLSTQADNTLDEFETFQVSVAGQNASSNQYFTACPPGPNTQGTGGFCYMEVERGDEKAYITNTGIVDGFVSTIGPDNVPLKYLRVYYSVGPLSCADANFATAVTSASDYKDLTFTSDSNNDVYLDDSTIDGLINGERYYFRFANVDAAGNVSYFSADQTVGGASAYLNCLNHTAVPGEVSGLLDGKECFIATAAYGSSTAPQLYILREFRDRFLKTNVIGRWFVKQYYNNSPKWAKKIKKREAARAAVRATLSPVIMMAQWVITYGLQAFILLSSFAFVLGFFVMRRVMRD